MDRDQTALEVIARISGREAAELTPEMGLVGDLGIDSPQALRLLMELERVLEIEISDEDAALMDSVGDVLDYLRRRA